MTCSICQTENPEDVQDCRSCSNPLSAYSNPGETVVVTESATMAFRDAPTMDMSHPGSAPTASVDLQSGSAFGPRYRIEGLLGQGGMGKVYRAYDRELSRTVALKLVRPELTANPQAMARFRQELLLASKISHRNILRIHDLGDVDGVKFISMALVEGMDLHDLIGKCGALPLTRALNIAVQLCRALDAAHAEGVIHRDLKPRNILVDSADHVHVTDFGLAKSVEAEAAGMTRTGDFIGTPMYMSPEQIESKPVDHRSDLYSLGLILYEMVTGDLPFAGKSSVQVMHSRMTTAPKDPRIMARDLPEYFACVIAKCLLLNVEERYQSAAEIRHDLEKGITPKRSLRKRLPKPNRTWAVIAAAMAIAAAATFFTPALRDRFFPKREIAGPTAPAYHIAVLPFRPLGDSVELKYQAEGIVEALNAKLFPLKQVSLASANTVERFAGKGDINQVAKDLGSNLLVQGTVQRGAGRLAINVSAWQASTNTTIWSQQFQCAPESLLATEDDIYNALVDHLKLKLSTRDVARGAARATEDSAAYDLYMRGRTLLRGKAVAENYRQALTLFDQATARDPHFARAYAGIAEACFGLYRITKDTQWSERGLGAAQQSVSLDKDLPDVHLVVGSGYLLTGKTTEAISEFNRAVELAPSSDEAYRRLSSAYRTAKNQRLALRNAKLATGINPYSFTNFNALGLAESEFGNYDAAVDAFKKVIQLQPDYAGGYNNIGGMFYKRGKWKECIPYFQKALDIDKSAQNFQNLGVVTLYTGNAAEAIRLFEEAARIAPKNHLNFGNLGDAYSAAGETAKASDAYQKAIDLAFAAWKLNSKDGSTLCNLALYYAAKGDGEQAEKFMRRARAIDDKDNSIMYSEGVVLHLAGKDERSLAALKLSLNNGYPVQAAANDYALRTMRTNPAFQSLIAEYSKTK